MTVKRTSSFVSRGIAISLLLIAVTTVSAQSRKEAIAEKSGSKAVVMMCLPSAWCFKQ